MNASDEPRYPDGSSAASTRALLMPALVSVFSISGVASSTSRNGTPDDADFAAAVATRSCACGASSGPRSSAVTPSASGRPPASARFAAIRAVSTSR